MKELSIFIDESGDFGKYKENSPYYIIGIVIHDQSQNISQAIKKLDTSLRLYDCPRTCVHVGPLIRHEKEYANLDFLSRIRILRKMLSFVAHANIAYQVLVVEKKHLQDEAELAEKLAKQLATFLKQHYNFFLGYDKIKVYYDNGQVEVTKIIVSVFTTLFKTIELKKAAQEDYKLSQVADLICTATLIELKKIHHTISRSERRMLGSDKNIDKMLLKPLHKKRFVN